MRDWQEEAAGSMEDERKIDAFMEEQYVTRRQRDRMIAKVPKGAVPLCTYWDASFRVEDVYPKTQTVFLYFNTPDGSTHTITENRE